MRRILLGIGLAWSAPFTAAAECMQLFETEMRELIEESYAALESEEPDLAEHSRLARLLDRRLPCAGFRVPRELWGKHLVSLAIREYFQQGDWRPPLTTALRIDPEVEIPVRSGHPLRGWEPSPRPPVKGPLSPSVRLWLDGVEIVDDIPLDALHLLQRQEEGQPIETLVVRGPDTIPGSWLISSRARRQRIRAAGTTASLAVGGAGAALIGIGSVQQARFRSDPEPDPGQQARANALVGAGSVLAGLGTVGLTTTWVVRW